jgi:hypothetical protein
LGQLERLVVVELAGDALGKLLVLLPPLLRAGHGHHAGELLAGQTVLLGPAAEILTLGAVPVGVRLVALVVALDQVVPDALPEGGLVHARELLHRGADLGLGASPEAQASPRRAEAR